MTNGMFTTDNALTWNLWAGCPHDVDAAEYSTHTQRWREALSTPQGEQHTNDEQMMIGDGGMEVLAPDPTYTIETIMEDALRLLVALKLSDKKFNDLCRFTDQFLPGLC